MSFSPICVFDFQSNSVTNDLSLYRSLYYIMKVRFGQAYSVEEFAKVAPKKNQIVHIVHLQVSDLNSLTGLHVFTISALANEQGSF